MKIGKVDPLICPKCRGAMKIIAFIRQPDVIQKILKHVGLWDAQKRPHPRAGPTSRELQTGHRETRILYGGDYSDPDYPFESYL